MKIILKLYLIVMLFSMSSCNGQTGCPAKKLDAKACGDFVNLKRNTILGMKFPEMKAQTLSKKDIIFPAETLGKPTILCLVFDGKAQSLVDTWTTPILEKYPNNEVNYYEIPMIKSVYKIIKGTIDNGMRKGVPEKLHKNVATYFGSLSDYKTKLMLDDTNNCFVFLLDKEGTIKYVSDNVADADKLNAMYTAIEKINNPLLLEKQTKKDKITYVFDPLCGFCYAFEPEMKKLQAKYKDKFEFEIIAGGMILGDREGPIAKVAPHIADGYKDLEAMSSARFGPNFLNKIMKDGTYKMSSELPSIALEVFKSMQPQNAISFANDIQMMLYYDGISLNEPANYGNLVKKYGIDATDFVSKLSLPEWKTKAYDQFALASKLGATSFPMLILHQDNKMQVLTSGFETYENLIKEYPFK
jgi:putative protein-disulfide isomerase